MKKLLFVLSTALFASIVTAQPWMPAVPCPAASSIYGPMAYLTPEQCQYDTELNAPLPRGNYQQSCNSVGWQEPGVITGFCQQVDSNAIGSTLKITPSCQYVQNINGQLSCN